MPKTTQTLFISDLHLSENQLKINQQFITLLNNIDESLVDAIYILGDLFEAWIGDDDNTSLHFTIKNALFKATQKVPIYFLPGNRDFLIGKRFVRETGCQLLPEHTKINLYGTPILLMHGDTLCTQDLAYLRARRFAYHPIVQKLFLLLPLFCRKKIGARLRAKSTRYTQSVSANIMDVTHSEVERLMRLHNVNYLIHGHTHRPAEHIFTLDNQNAKRVVLAAWHNGGEVLRWFNDGSQSIQKL